MNHLTIMFSDDALPKKSVTRAPKFEVYRPGVSRLSNRSINFEGSNDSTKSPTR